MEALGYSSLGDPSKQNGRLLLAIGGTVGRLSIEGGRSFLVGLRRRYLPFTIPSASWVRSDFVLSLHLRPSNPGSGGVLSQLDRQAPQVSFSVNGLEIRRHDFDIRFANTKSGWEGEGSCQGSHLAFEVLLRTLWSALLSRADGALLHACALRIGSGAALLPGVSGAGKSTLSGKWEPQEDVLSDELVPVRRGADGVWRVYSSPFWGGLRSGGRSLAGWPLQKVAFLAQADTEEAIPLPPAEAAARLMTTALNCESSSGAERTLRFAAAVATEVPAVELRSRKDTPTARLRKLLGLEPSREHPAWSARENISEVRAALHRAGAYALQVNGVSMLPAVQPGDTVFLEPFANEKATFGDIVVYWQPAEEPVQDKLICHRLLSRRSSGRVFTKGDHAASWESLVDGHQAELLARVSGIARGGVMLPAGGWLANCREVAFSAGRMIWTRTKGAAYGIMPHYSS